MIYMVAAIAAMAGFLFGFDEGVIAGAEESLNATFTMSRFVDGFMTAAVPLGALFGALLAGRISDRMGRRKVLLGASVVFLAGSLIAATAPSVEVLTAARVLLGIAIGVAGMVAPLYLSETSDARRRGAFVAAYQLLITVGIVAAYFADYVLEELGWRYMFACGMVPAVILFVGSLRLPESPRWLALKGDMARARASLMALRGNDSAAVEAELAEIAAISSLDRAAGTWADLASKRVRPAAVAALGLYILQQLSGINAVIYYAPEIFKHTGIESHSAAVLATVGVGLVNVAMTLVSMWLIDRLGRRKLLFIGLVGIVASLLGLAALATWGGAGLAWLSIAAVMVYIGAFAISLGPVPHIMMSEVFPLNLRGRGMGVASVANWGSNFLVVLLFPVALHALGIAGVMIVFAAVCVAGFVFTARRVPETRGVPLEEIELRLDEGRLLQRA